MEVCVFCKNVYYKKFTDTKQEMPVFDFTFICPYLIPLSVSVKSLWERHE